MRAQHRIVLIRHGETAWSARRRHSSCSDTPLGADGLDAAATVADLVKGWDFALVLSSGESLDDVGARADRVIDRASGADGDVALVAHAHFLRVLGARWIELPPGQGRHLTLDTASMSVLGWERDTRVIQRWNVRQW